MLPRDYFSRRQQRRKLRAGQLAEPVERRDLWMAADLDHAERKAREILFREPVEDLQQLQLVVQVVLEPEDDLVLIAERRQRGVALGESGPKCIVVAVSAQVCDLT